MTSNSKKRKLREENLIGFFKILFSVLKKVWEFALYSIQFRGNRQVILQMDY
jgi:hypothetical protein